MVRDKFRIRFRKCRDLRLVSHHDLLRCFERMLRRAALPFHSTSGFNPKPRLVFALSLALGIEGHDEVVELELDEQMSEREVHERLAAQAPPGLEITSVRRIDPKATAQPRRARYRIELPPDDSDALPERIRALPGALAVGAISGLPINSEENNSNRINYTTDTKELSDEAHYDSGRLPESFLRRLVIFRRLELLFEQAGSLPKRTRCQLQPSVKTLQDYFGLRTLCRLS